MFGYQNNSGTCGCGCSEGGACVQQKIMSALVTGCTSCSDLANAVAYINANFSSVSPLSEAWASHVLGWQYSWQGTFDAPADGTPDGAFTDATDGVIGGGLEYQNITTAAVNISDSDSITGFATRTSFQLPDSIIYVAASYYSVDNAFIWQSACKMTGTPLGCGYVFDIPIPPLDLCASSESASSGGGGPDYNVFTTSTYSGIFEDYVWGAFVTMCAANPTTCNPSIDSTPPDCLTPDPFYGDDPP